MAISGKSLGTAFGINGAVCVVAVVVFSILRVRTFTRRFYMPRRYDPGVPNKPWRLPNSLFGWMAPVLGYPEDAMLSSAGMDSVVMSRLLMYGWVLFAFATFWCCALLMPINATAGFLGPVGPNSTFSDLDYVGVANVAPGDMRLWAHLGSVYVVSAVALLLLLAFSRDISRLRARYMSMMPRGGASNTVLITDIPCVDGVGAAAHKPGPLDKLTAVVNRKGGPPPDTSAEDDALVSKEVAQASAAPPRLDPLPDDALDPYAAGRAALAAGDADAMVRAEMERTYGADNVVAVNVVGDTRKLDPLLAKYEATKQQLDDLNSNYLGKLKRDEPIKKRTQVTLLPGIAPAWAKSRYNVGATKVAVDALEYLPLALDETYREIQKEKASVKDARLPAAFVTFRDRLTASAAATGLHALDETAWRMQPAPGSDELIWSNLPMRENNRLARRLLMGAAFVALLLFYLPVTAAIQAVVNLDNVRQVPGLGEVTRIPFVTQVLQGILPSLVLKIFLILVPPILAAMARFEGKCSLSEVDFSIVTRFFVFQVFATFIYQFVVGSALGQVQELIKDPTGKVVQIMGVSAAQTSSFFCSYIMLAALAVGMGLLRLVPLILFAIFYRLAGTERAQYRLWAKQPYAFGTNVANHTIIMLLGLAFCCLAPLIAPFALLYFSLALVAQKYQLLYVVTLPYDAAGRMWMNCFHQIMVGIYFLQLMLLCVLAVKKFPYALLVLPLLAFSLLFHIVNAKRFRRPWTLGNAREAAALDARDRAPVTPAEAEEIRQRYLSPVHKIDEAEHAKLIAEAADIDAKLKALPAPAGGAAKGGAAAAGSNGKAGASRDLEAGSDAAAASGR